MDQAEGLRKMVEERDREVCPACGQPIMEKSNLELARMSLERFRERVFTDIIIERAEKMAEQYEEAILDAVEDEQERIRTLIKGLDLRGYILDQVSPEDVHKYILESIFSKS